MYGVGSTVSNSRRQQGSGCQGTACRCRSFSKLCEDQELIGIQRGNTYASRPEPNSFRTSIWPWRLPLISAGPQFRYLRKLYQNLLSPQRATQLRTYQEFESRILLRDLQNHLESFYEDIDRYSLSVIFFAVYGIRLKTPDHPITVELFDTWLLMLQRERSYRTQLATHSDVIQICNQARSSSIMSGYFRGYRHAFSPGTGMQ